MKAYIFLIFCLKIHLILCDDIENEAIQSLRHKYVRRDNEIRTPKYEQVINIFHTKLARKLQENLMKGEKHNLFQIDDGPHAINHMPMPMDEYNGRIFVDNEPNSIIRNKRALQRARKLKVKKLSQKHTSRTHLRTVKTNSIRNKGRRETKIKKLRLHKAKHTQ